jgi:hypothetical protein
MINDIKVRIQDSGQDKGYTGKEQDLQVRIQDMKMRIEDI